VANDIDHHSSDRLRQRCTSDQIGSHRAVLAGADRQATTSGSRTAPLVEQSVGTKVDPQPHLTRLRPHVAVELIDDRVGRKRSRRHRLMIRACRLRTGIGFGSR
jgi:hypothetical protein